MPTIDTNQMARYTITVAGNDVSQSSPQGLEALSVEDHLDMVGMAELTFGGNLGTQWGSLETGADVEISLGGDTYKVFVGTIVGLRHAFQRSRDSLTVVAMDPAAKLAASRHVKVYEEMTDSDVINQVLSDAGVPVGEVESTPEVRKYTLQRNESDLLFCRRLAARNGLLLRSQEGEITCTKPQFSGGSTTLKKNEVISLDYTFSTRNVPSELTVYGWDYLTKEKVEGTASAGDIEPIGGGTNVVSNTGQTWQDPSFVSDVWVNSQSGAKDLAAAELNRLARSFLRGRAIVQGNGALHAGGLVKFEDHRSGFNAEVYIISSRHRVFQGSGFTTEIVFCSNTFPQ